MTTPGLRTLRKIAVRTSYTLSALCFVGAAIACGESDHPLWLIMTIVAACMGGMVGFYWLAEVIDRG